MNELVKSVWRLFNKTDKKLDAILKINHVIIRRVYLCKKNNSKHITVPQRCDINAGDYISIEKVTLNE